MVTATENLTMCPENSVIDCACLIHGTVYDWTYVEKLYSMLNRHLSNAIRFHVYTEKERPVPAPMIKHELEHWGIDGPRRAWWYKIQLFNSGHHAGPLLYFDLDTVIVGNIDWITQLPLKFFWSLQDFKYLWRPQHQGINSSVMWWNTTAFDSIWKTFNAQNLPHLMKQYPGDQDYITKQLDPKFVRFFPQDRIQSWRWQCLNGGYDFKRRIYKQPGLGTTIAQESSVLIFHGRPKPAEIQDPAILDHWK